MNPLVIFVPAVMQQQALPDVVQRHVVAGIAVMPRRT
jgi:hypothetical protein